MDILSALFISNREFYQAPGGATRFDITGAYFSMAAPSPVPVTLEPHLLCIIRCRLDESPNNVLETLFKNAEGEQVARNVAPLTIPQGLFGQQLVRAELSFDKYETVEAHIRVGQSEHWTVVPLTLLPPFEGAAQPQAEETWTPSS